MVSGHLTEKNGSYYIVLNLFDRDGNRKPKWVATGLSVIRGNKKKAEVMLIEERQKYSNDRPEQLTVESSEADMLFGDFIEHVWLPTVKHSIEQTTYSSYLYSVNVVAPYFRAKGITLGGIRAKDIEEFYITQLDRVKGSSVVKYHANIHSALKLAVRKEIIPSNPAENVDRPKIKEFTGIFCDSDEMNKLMEAVKGTNIELAVMLGFYGFRRSEIVGLKWDAVDFTQNTISIQYTVTSCTLNGKRTIVEKNRTKNKSSRRTLPMIPALRDKLQSMLNDQAKYRKLCGRSYCKDYLEFVYVNEVGERIKPDYISGAFQNILKKHELKKMRFHDLRHSCASLLLASGISMKMIQEWLGHSDFGTTANIYAHLSYDSKLSSADALQAQKAFGKLESQ